MNSEIGGQRPDAKSALVIPRLTSPYEGVYDEINRDYYSDPTAFLNKVEFNLSKENPALAELLPRYVDITTPEISNYSRKWVLIYYEMFSRSGRKAGFPLACFITTELLGTTVRQELNFLKSSLDSLSAIRRENERSKNQSQNRRIRDEENVELRRFWKTVDEDVKTLSLGKYTREEAEGAKARLLFFQRVIQEHGNQYGLSALYMDRDPLKGLL